METSLSRSTQYMLFALGAALGSAFGLIIGSLLTFWLGEEALRALQRRIRRVTGGDDQPSLDLMLQ